MRKQQNGELIMVTVRYYAGAGAAAGVQAEPVTVPAGTTIADLREELVRLHGSALAQVLPACSLLVDESAGEPLAALRPGAILDVLPPFAGG